MERQEKGLTGMAGIYLHIPFCERRCSYCDFFSTTRLERRGAYIGALMDELAMRADYLPKDSVIGTIYFGGGTPSQLDAADVGKLLDAIARQYNVLNDAEITLEANPSDLTMDYLEQLSAVGVNRLSIGIQSFQGVLLRTLGRRHDAATAKNCVRTAQASGFKNISIDLMYGLPHQTLAQWRRDLEDVIALGVQHISTYCLSYENNTLFGKMLAEESWKRRAKNWQTRCMRQRLRDLMRRDFISMRYRTSVCRITIPDTIPLTGTVCRIWVLVQERTHTMVCPGNGICRI